MVIINNRMRLNIVKAEKGGFCFGVRRAVNCVFDCVGRGGKVYTYGPLIHNPDVLAELAQKGVHSVEDLSLVNPGDTLVIRSHGVKKQVFDECLARGITVQDATCPCVQHIQRKVQEVSSQGRRVIIVGEHDHPEVIGIASWCDNAIIVFSPQEAQAVTGVEDACIVAQTTTPPAIFDELTAILRQRIGQVEVYNSICRATQDRQDAASRLASQVDGIVVLGGRNSSNTRKLYDLCSRICPDTLWIERASELDLRLLAGHHTIGIISGASTPDWIIEEVFKKMSDFEVNSGAPEAEQLQEAVAEAAVQPEAIANEQSAQPEEAVQPDAVQESTVAQPDQPQQAEASQTEEPVEKTFAERLEETVRSIRPGQVITGTVVQVTDSEVCVNIGYKADGIVPKSDFTADGDVDLKATIQVGDSIDVQVKKVNDGEGNVLLSCKDIAARKNWDKLMAEYEAGAVFEGVGKSVVKGGLIANIYGIRAFIPASQLDVRYVNDLNEFIGQTMQLKIIEVEKQRHRVVASRRAMIEEEQRQQAEALWGELQSREGEVVHGVVRRLTDFGAFVDVGGIDGLVHVTDLGWGRVRTPKDVVSVNQEVDVVILKVDMERKRLSLGYKQLQPKPWDLAPEKYLVGEVVEGRVVRMVSFGAFVELEPGIDGLVHISQIANRRIEKVEDVLQNGDVVNVRILEVNPEEKRISLSIRDTLAPEEDEGQPELDYTPAVNENGAVYSTADDADATGSIGDMIDIDQFEE